MRVLFIFVNVYAVCECMCCVVYTFLILSPFLCVVHTFLLLFASFHFAAVIFVRYKNVWVRVFRLSLSRRRHISSCFVVVLGFVCSVCMREFVVCIIFKIIIFIIIRPLHFYMNDLNK